MFFLRRRWGEWGRCYDVYFPGNFIHGQKLVGISLKSTLWNSEQNLNGLEAQGSKWGEGLGNVSFPHLNGICIHLAHRRTTLANHIFFIIIYNWLLLKKNVLDFRTLFCISSTSHEFSKHTIISFCENNDDIASFLIHIPLVNVPELSHCLNYKL